MTVSWGFELAEVELPELDVPRAVPVIPGATYEQRIARVVEAMTSRGLDALVLYADREHFANMAFLTGFDPRYEEALLVLIPGRKPCLIVGNEDVAYAEIVPYEIDVVRLAKLSLVGQPDPGDVTMHAVLSDAGLGDDGIRRVGLVGWKYFTGTDATEWIDVPHFVVTEVARFVDTYVNATDIFVGIEHGVRYDNDVDQIASLEFAASHASQSVIRLIKGIKPGLTELEATQLMNPILMPFNYHPTMLSGPNTSYGVASAGGRELQIGDPVASGIGLWGSNTARAGFLVESAAQLPEASKDYLEKLVVPYYATAAAWYETIRIGLRAGELYDTVHSRIGDSFFGLFLNPGHFIGLDEWPGSPVSKGSDIVFKSGNAIQLDIIPMPERAYHTAQIEDGIALADADLRAQLQEQYPDVWRRIQVRRDMLQHTFGIEVHEEVLPLSNSAGWFPPFWLAPHLAMRRS